MKLCRSHHIQSAATKGNEPNQSGETVIVSQPLFCDKHTDEMLIVYCNECQCLVCRQCITDLHFGHKFNPIDSSTRSEVETQIKGLLEETTKKLLRFDFYLDYVKTAESRKVNAPDKLKKEINDACKNLKRALEQRRDELLSQVDVCGLKQLWAQKEVLETTITALQGSIAFAKRVINCNSDAEMLALCPQVKSRLRELNLSRWDPTAAEKIDSTQTVFQQTGVTPEIAQFGVVSNCSTFGTIPDLSLKIQSSDSASEQNTKEGQLGKQVNVIVKFQVQPSFIDQPVNVNVLSLGGQQSIKNQTFPPIKINSMESQHHHVEVVFRPLVSGQHTISVNIGSSNGQVHMKVSGKPNVGDQVVKGPNWQTPSNPGATYYQQYGYHYRQQYYYNYGVVTDNSMNNMITVKWDEQVTAQHYWDEPNNTYEIQLQ